MSSEDKIKDAVGHLRSSTGRKPLLPTPMGLHGPETPEQLTNALADDVKRLYEALLVLGREVDRLRGEVGNP